MSNFDIKEEMIDITEQIIPEIHYEDNWMDRYIDLLGEAESNDQWGFQEMFSPQNIEEEEKRKTLKDLEGLDVEDLEEFIKSIDDTIREIELEEEKIKLAEIEKSVNKRMRKAKPFDIITFDGGDEAIILNEFEFEGTTFVYTNKWKSGRVLGDAQMMEICTDKTFKVIVDQCLLMQLWDEMSRL